MYTNFKNVSIFLEKMRNHLAFRRRLTNSREHPINIKINKIPPPIAPPVEICDNSFDDCKSSNARVMAIPVLVEEMSTAFVLCVVNLVDLGIFVVVKLGVLLLNLVVLRVLFGDLVVLCGFFGDLVELGVLFGDLVVLRVLFGDLVELRVLFGDLVVLRVLFGDLVELRVLLGEVLSVPIVAVKIKSESHTYK